MLANFIEKIAAQESFEEQVEIAELTFAGAVASRGESFPSYVLSEAERERLNEVDSDVVMNEFLERFGKYCRELYGPRWVGRND